MYAPSLFDTEQLVRTRSNESKTGRGSLDSKNLKKTKRNKKGGKERKKNEEVRGRSGSGNEDLAQRGVGVINARADRVECFNQPPNPRILTSLC